MWHGRPATSCCVAESRCSCPSGKVEVFTAPLGSETPYLQHSITGGFSMLDDFSVLRHAGATVRAMMKAAAEKWGVPIEELVTQKGVVSHEKTKNTATYGELVPVAKNLPVPTDFALKSPASGS